VNDGDEIAVGRSRFKVLHTQAIVPGNMSVWGRGDIYRDTIFAGSVGRTDFPGGSVTDLKRSFQR